MPGRWIEKAMALAPRWPSERLRIPCDAPVLFDFTITPASRCHRCGYALMGLRPTGRCPECGTHVVESLYLASAANQRRVDARSRWELEKAVVLGEWKLAAWLALLGGLMAAAWLVMAIAGAARPESVGPVLVLGCVSALSMVAGLRLVERLGLAGFPSRRSQVELTILVHIFAIGTALLLGGRVAGDGGTLTLPVLAAVPLSAILRSNAPDPWQATQVVFFVQVVGCVVAFAVAQAL